MDNRATRRQRARQERRDNKPVLQGLTAGQLKEAEAELAAGATSHESSRGTTMAVLAHGWFALDHQREASRMTYERIVELRKGGRELKTDTIVQQYAEAKEEILVLESQIVDLLEIVAAEDGDDPALSLLAASHMNLMNGLGVRFPLAIRARFAMEAGLSDAPPPETMTVDSEGHVVETDGPDSKIDPPDPEEPKAEKPVELHEVVAVIDPPSDLV